MVPLNNSLVKYPSAEQDSPRTKVIALYDMRNGKWCLILGWRINIYINCCGWQVSASNAFTWFIPWNSLFFSHWVILNRIFVFNDTCLLSEQHFCVIMTSSLCAQQSSMGSPRRVVKTDWLTWWCHQEKQLSCGQTADGVPAPPLTHTARVAWGGQGALTWHTELDRDVTNIYWNFLGGCFFLITWLESGICLSGFLNIYPVLSSVALSFLTSTRQLSNQTYHSDLNECLL